MLHSAGPGEGKPQIFVLFWLAMLLAVGWGTYKSGALGYKRASWDQCAGLSFPSSAQPGAGESQYNCIN